MGEGNPTSITRDIQDILVRLHNVKKSNGGYTARCPAHADKENSLSVSAGRDDRILVKCHAGCMFEQIAAAMGLEPKDFFPNSMATEGARASNKRNPDLQVAQPVTLESLSQDKGIPITFLTHYVTASVNHVIIHYRNFDGTPARDRLRFALIASKGSRWGEGKESPIAYGVWRVPRMAQKSDSLLLVEGESDSWTAWYHNIAALGIPGADMTSKLTQKDIEPFKRVYVWREPDRGGEVFVKGVIYRLMTEFQYTGDIFIVDPPKDEVTGQPIKDINEMHKHVLRACGVKPSDINVLDANAESLKLFKYKFKKAWETLITEKESSPENATIQSLSETPPVIPVADYIVKERAKKQQALTGCTFALTDMGNADRMLYYCGDDILYCYTWKKWLIWSETHWAKDVTGEIERKAESTVKTILTEADKEKSGEMYAEIVTHAKRSQSTAQIGALIERTKNRRPVEPPQLDTDLMAFNTQNGTLNLRTGELKAHQRADLITKISPVAYDSNAKAPLWDKFLQTVTEQNDELISFLQRVVGYTLSGDTTEHCMFFLHGTGRNGKSVFLNVLAYVMGDYGSSVRPDVLMAKPQGDTIPNEIAALNAVRSVFTIETESGRRLAESMLKQFTGGDTVSARFLHSEFFNFRPQFKIFMASNHKPVIRGQDVAIWERIHLIPFNKYIKREDRDPFLEQKLCKEAPGILKWALDGCIAWQSVGLRPPSIVKIATDDYRSEMDLLAEFLEDVCVFQHRATVPKASLWKSYAKWCTENSVKYPINRREFKECLLTKGVLDKKTAGVRVWENVRLVDEEYLADEYAMSEYSGGSKGYGSDRYGSDRPRPRVQGIDDATGDDEIY